MKEKCMERSVSRGARKTVHGIVQYQLWKCVDIVNKKCDIPEDCISSIVVRTDTVDKGLLHINFTKQQMLFTIRSIFGNDCELSVWHMGDEEIMMLKTESMEILGEA